MLTRSPPALPKSGLLYTGSLRTGLRQSNASSLFASSPSADWEQVSKKTEAAWAKVRDGQTRIGLLRENTGGLLGLYTQRLSEGVPDEELGKIALRGAVAFRALSLACELAAEGGEDLVRANPIRMNRRQASFMGQAIGQRHYFALFHEVSISFADLARLHGATIRNIEGNAKEFSDRVVESNRNRTAW